MHQIDHISCLSRKEKHINHQDLVIQSWISSVIRLALLIRSIPFSFVVFPSFSTRSCTNQSDNESYWRWNSILKSTGCLYQLVEQPRVCVESESIRLAGFSLTFLPDAGCIGFDPAWWSYRSLRDCQTPLVCWDVICAGAFILWLCSYFSNHITNSDWIKNHEIDPCRSLFNLIRFDFLFSWRSIRKMWGFPRINTESIVRRKNCFRRRWPWPVNDFVARNFFRKRRARAQLYPVG